MRASVLHFMVETTFVAPAEDSNLRVCRSGKMLNFGLVKL